MIFKLLYLYITGSMNIIVEGFFLERFINICKNNDIILWKLNVKNGTILTAIISKNDFEKIQKISRETSCKVTVNRKNGLPVLMEKLKKRKIFAIATLVIAFFLFFVTRFMWNIEINGLENISKEEMLSCLANYGIEEGKLKSNLKLDEIKNNIMLERDDLSWIGIEIKGTNVIVTVVESTKKPEILDENSVTNIFASKSGTISKMVVRNGTARVNIGDNVNKGDLLVEGVIEGKYTGARQVNSDADIYITNQYEKEKKETFIQEIDEKTGNEENKIEIYINNFKIIFNKGVPKFEKYDTIRAYKKIKLFSNYYFPIEVVKITDFELKGSYKEYTEDELTQKIINELQSELNNELKISDFNNIQQNNTSVVDEDGVTVKVIYIIEENIGTKEY